jgi:hypothetical protein
LVRLNRTAALVSLVALAGLSCGKSGAPASGNPDSSAQAPNPISQYAASQTFTGTVVVKDSASGTSSTNDEVIGGSTTQTDLNSTVVFTVTHDGVVAKISYESKNRVDHEARYQYHKVVGSKTEATTASGTNNDASVSIDLRSDGTYQIAFSSGGVTGQYRMEDTATLTCTNLGADPTCRPGTTSSSDSGAPPGIGGTGGTVDGRIDPAHPNVLVGTEAQQRELNDGSIATRTVTWNLSH